MKMKKISISALAITAVLSVSFGYAGEGRSHDEVAKHQHSDMKHGKHEAHKEGVSQQIADMFMTKKEVDGYTVSFHVMVAKEGMQHGGSHNLMVKIEKDGVVQTNVVINSKVKHPNGQSDTKKLMKMGDWYMTAYNLGHAGKHQLMVLFKTMDGEKHKTGVYYAG